MSTNKTNFTGWSGKTDFLSGFTFDMSKLTLSGATRSETPKSSRIVTGPVVIDKTPKTGSSRTPSSGPIYKTGDTQTQTVSNRRSVNAPLGTSLPFTAGTVDYSFPAGGGYDIDGFDGGVYHIMVDSNGKYLIGGSFGKYYFNGNDYFSPYLIRLNPDGTVDESFDITYNNDCYGGGFDGTVYSIELQSDGKILVGGDFTRFDRDNNCNNAVRIIRLNSDGSRDLTFNTGDGFDSSVYDIRVQPNGKILVGGDFEAYNGVDSYHIIRLNSNGSIDSSFLIGKNNISFDGFVNIIVLQSDGKILVGGRFTAYGNVSQNYISRLNTDGTLDTTFQIGNGFNNEVYTIALQSDGKIIVGGYFDEFDNNDLFYGKIVRLTSDGTLDTLFGYGLNNQVHSLAIQSDGKILVGGYMDTYIINNSNIVTIHKLCRFNSDCSFDYTFYSEGIFNDGVEYISILGDDNVLVGGFFNGFLEDPSVYPLNHFGRLNNSISEYPYTYTVEACYQPLMDETITYVVGSMTELNPFVTYSFQSLQNPSITVCGYLIPEYPSNVIEYSMVNEYTNCEEAYTSNYQYVTIQDYLNGNTSEWPVDNKYQVGDIVYVDYVFDGMGRTFAKFAGTITSVITWDNPVWDFLPALNYVPYSSGDDAIEANGVHYVAISCTEEEVNFPLIHKPYYNGSTLLIPTGSNPVKFLVDYLPINDYGLISGDTPEIYSTIEIADGEDCTLGLTKISPNGILNGNFYDGGFNGELVYAIVEQPDGKILVGGDFDEYDGTTVGNFMRLNSDGTLDDTFYLGGFNSENGNMPVATITLQPDGKILVGGDFDEYDGEYAGHIIRLNSDGTIDQDFTYGVEFNGMVRAIAVQRDGKIVVGGEFSRYGAISAKHLIRLNSDGTPDPTLVIGFGFSNGGVYTINIETIRDTPFYWVNNSLPTYTENIIVGGGFDLYNSMTANGIVKLSPTGNMLSTFGEGFNVNGGERPRVTRIIQQPDGKLIIIGGSNNGNDLVDYNGTCIPQNMVRLMGNGEGGYQIDPTFIPYPNGENCYDGYDAGFNKAVLSVALLPNGKYMVGGQFSRFKWYGDEVLVPYLVRLNSDGSLDETFTFTIDDNYVNKVLLLSSGRLLVGGWFNTPAENLLELFIGEEYELRSFDTCDGLISNIFVPIDSPIVPSSSLDVVTATTITYEPISIIGLDLAYDGDYDDDNFVIVMPTPFDVTFLGTNYTSVNVSSNPYITFGEGGDPSDCCFDIPNEIPTSTELPGVYLSFACPQEIGDYDGQMYQLYTGLTDGGNTMVIKFIGSDHCDDIATLVYGFKFYKDNSDYFDLVIEENTQFFNDDPTGGVSNGVDETWVTTFDSTPGNAYRIGYTQVIGKPIKANVNDRVSVCGTVGNVITTPNLSNTIGIPGSMYFNGTDSLVTVANNINMDMNFGSWTVEWFQYYTSLDDCCKRIFSIGSDPGEEFAVSLNVDVLRIWMASGQTATTLVNPIKNVWTYFAITSENLGGNNQIIRVFQDGVLINDFLTDVDINNFNDGGSLPLTIGGMNNGGEIFEGYITNFRWNKGTCYYTSTFDVPTNPLTTDGSQLLLLASNESDVIYDSTETQSISSSNVTWSELNPFVSQYNFSLFTATDFTNYDTCNDCNQILNTILYVRTGITEYVTNRTMTKTNINSVLINGPIFTTGGVEAYEILNYYY